MCLTPHVEGEGGFSDVQRSSLLRCNIHLTGFLLPVTNLLQHREDGKGSVPMQMPKLIRKRLADTQ